MRPGQVPLDQWLQVAGDFWILRRYILAGWERLAPILPRKDGLNKLKAPLSKTEQPPLGKQPRREIECILNQRTKLADLF